VDNSTLNARRDYPKAFVHLDRHPVHGLIAIANGPDYCLCGNLWPCRPADELRS